MAAHNEPRTRPIPPAHLALICQHFYPEMVSTGMHMTELATGLAARGHAIRVYCARPAYSDKAHDEPTPQRLWHKGVEVVRVPSWGNPRGEVASRGLFALSYLLMTLLTVWRERRGLEGIIATTNPPFIGLVAVLLRWLLSMRFVTIVYDVYPDIAVRLGTFSARSPIVWLWSRITRLILRQSARLIVIGRDMAEVVAGKVPPSHHGRIELIPNWSDETRVCPRARAGNPFAQAHNGDGRFVVQYSGRMGRTHNLEPLLAAADLLRDEPVRFQLIGDGAKRRRLEALARARKLTNVQFLPYQPIEILDQVLSAPDLAVVCLDERFTGLSVPSKTYGVMAAGRPLLGFLDPQGEIARTISENECGAVLPHPDGAQVAAVIRELMHDPARLAQLGDNGRRAFLRAYTLSHAVDRYDRVLNACFGAVASPSQAECPA